MTAHLIEFLWDINYGKMHDQFCYHWDGWGDKKHTGRRGGVGKEEEGEVSRYVM